MHYPSIYKLLKFLNLESDRGFDNKAVFGGLEQMLSSWESEAHSEDVPEPIIQAVITRLRDYPRLSQKSRQETLHGLWRRIQIDLNLDGKQNDPFPPVSRVAPAKQVRQQHQDPQTHEGAVAIKAIPRKKESSIIQSNEQTPQKSSVEISMEVVPSDEPEIDICTDVGSLPGIGPRSADKLDRLDIHQLRDILYYFPRRYDDYTQLLPINRLTPGDEVTVIGKVDRISTREIHSRRSSIVEVLVSDGSGVLRVTWFNQPWLTKQITPGMFIVLSGKIDEYLGRNIMNSPDWERLEKQHLHTNRIVPIYRASSGINQRWIRRMTNKVLSYCTPRVKDPLPKWIKERRGLMNLPAALMNIHFPDNHKLLNSARERLAFDEIFLLQMAVLQQKNLWRNRTGKIFDYPLDWLSSLESKLDFSLTNAQHSVLEDISKDLSSGIPMNRLLQGDVGSGKTIVAALSISIVLREGYQAAIMAPTSILAEQHYQNLQKLFCDSFGMLEPSELRLLLGSSSASEKKEILDKLDSGICRLVIGTHALIEEPVKFNNLQFVVIDEQHRFGVNQRTKLRTKGDNPHLLAMTATPIPRSLSLTLYGDLDLSIIDEVPPGREEIITRVLYPQDRENAYSFIRNQIAKGRQGFIIYSLVEEGSDEQVRAAVEEHQRLQEDVFRDLHLGLLHGRMKQEEKDSMMTRFRDKEFDILISTSVVEVGVDFPNASVMMIDGANRFGLAQLHQLRGRVGRGDYPSYCILVPFTSDGVENERLQAMVDTNDGFVLAERDLQQRGPGEFLGYRQSGYAGLRLANLADVKMIEATRAIALELMAKDPELISPENQSYTKAITEFWNNQNGELI